MKEKVPVALPLSSAKREDQAGHAGRELAEVPASMPVASPPGVRRVRLGRVSSFLLATLVGMLVLAGGLGLLISLVQRPTNPASPTSAFQTISCPFPLAAGVVEGKDVRCGYLIVPEDHSRPQGPTIRLAVAIFKAPSSHPATDPVVYLQGGPGTALLANFGPVITPTNISNFTTVDRDLILLDQRGVGYSRPSLDCPESNTMPLATSQQVLRACRDRLIRQGINLDDYTTIQNSEDVHDLVHVLGYQQVDLYGISYGTRLALSVMRLFPADIRSVVLDSTAPPQVNLDASLPAATKRAFDTLFQGCAANTYCNEHYPHLQAVLMRLVSELNQHPAIIQESDPQTDKPVRGVLRGDDVVSGLRTILYETALIPKLPKLIYQLANHDYAQATEIIEMAQVALDSDSVGMFYSVWCSESTLTPQSIPVAVKMVEPEMRHYFLSTLQDDYANCQLWHVQPIPAVQRQPVTSAIPTLILAGEYDPATPPAYGLLAAHTLSRSYFFLFAGMGHGVIGGSSCDTRMFQAFLEQPTKKPESTCMAGVGEPLFE